MAGVVRGERDGWHFQNRDGVGQETLMVVDQFRHSNVGYWLLANGCFRSTGWLGSAACAAASRAIGTRNGEQDT